MLLVSPYNLYREIFDTDFLYMKQKFSILQSVILLLKQILCMRQISQSFRKGNPVHQEQSSLEFNRIFLCLHNKNFVEFSFLYEITFTEFVVYSNSLVKSERIL